MASKNTIREIPPEQIETALRHLRKRDKTLRRIIDTHGPMTLTLDPDPFPVLVRSIIAQQISGQHLPLFTGRF